MNEVSDESDLTDFSKSLLIIWLDMSRMWLSVQCPVSSGSLLWGAEQRAVWGT